MMVTYEVEDESLKVRVEKKKADGEMINRQSSSRIRDR
jgi:hypothetical protein